MKQWTIEVDGVLAVETYRHMETDDVLTIKTVYDKGTFWLEADEKPKMPKHLDEWNMDYCAFGTSDEEDGIDFAEYEAEEVEFIIDGDVKFVED